MNEKIKKEFLEELENSSFEELLGLLCFYVNAHEEREFVNKFILKNFKEKPFREYLKSLKDIPGSFDDREKADIDAVRVCAREIIDHIDFDMIFSLADIKDIVSTQIKITESFGGK